jgi:hypothetical protein
MTTMDAHDLRAFAGRDWAAAAEAKRGYWAECYRRDGSAPARRASALLFEHARRLGLPLFDGAQRDADLEHHRILCERLDRAARALADR